MSEDFKQPLEELELNGLGENMVRAECVETNGKSFTQLFCVHPPVLKQEGLQYGRQPLTGSKRGPLSLTKLR